MGGGIPRCHRRAELGSPAPARVGRGKEGAGGSILTLTCCWILLLKYFWMSLRLVAEQRARWVSSLCREDKR